MPCGMACGANRPVSGGPWGARERIDPNMSEVTCQFPDSAMPCGMACGANRPVSGEPWGARERIDPNMSEITCQFPDSAMPCGKAHRRKLH
jgi:hypothetical protein